MNHTARRKDKLAIWILMCMSRLAFIQRHSSANVCLLYGVNDRRMSIIMSTNSEHVTLHFINFSYFGNHVQVWYYSNITFIEYMYTYQL